MFVKTDRWIWPEAAVALLRENYKSVLESVSSVLHQCGRALCIFSSMFKVFMYLFSIARTETKTDVLFFTLRGKYKEPQFEQPFRGLLTFWTSQSERTEKTIHLFGLCWHISVEKCRNWNRRFHRQFVVLWFLSARLSYLPGLLLKFAGFLLYQCPRGIYLTRKLFTS